MTKNPPIIKAIIFDMDGLMIDTERLAQRAWRKASAEWNYMLSDETYLSVVGRNVKDTEAMFLESFGPDFPFREMYDKKQTYMYEDMEQNGIPIKPGLPALLDFIGNQNLAKAIATSTARPTAIKKLTITGLINSFSTIVCGDEVAHGKPAPDIFLKAASALGMPPENCLVLEDSEAGVKGAHTAGMTPIMVPDMKYPSDEIRQLVYRVLDSLVELPALLVPLISVDRK
ncbi:MAG: HAD family phosphatase [Chloroflexota bacterium]